MPKEEQKRLLTWLVGRVHDQNGVRDEKGKNAAPEERLSVRDMLNNPLDLGEILRPFGPDDDFLGEMLEGDRRFDPRS